MYLLNLEQWVSAVFVDALGATFAHSLWQALIALIACHVALAIAKKASPALRYNMLVAISVALAVAVAITFIVQINPASSSDALVSYVPFQDILTNTSGTAMPVVMESQRYLALVSDFLKRYMDVLIAVWFIIFCFKWLRLTLGLNYIKRIARFESSAADYNWLHKLSELKRKLGINRPVQLLKSYMINTPVVTGYFRPVIIVPVSLFSNIPPDLVESILLHELAHIRRRDYLVNMLQSIAETIFFFNPFILKISSLMKDERENCCDALAVDVVKSKVSYVEALVAFGEYSNKAQTAVAFAGRKNYLLQRVKRILYNQNKKPGVMEKSILTCGVILFLGLAVFSTVNGTEKVLNSSLAHKFQEIVKDTVPAKQNKQERAREVKRAQRSIRQHEAKVAQKQKELQAAVEAMQADIQKVHEELGEDVEINDNEINALIDSKINLENELNFKTDVNVDLEKINELNLQNIKLQKEIAMLQQEKIKPMIQKIQKEQLKQAEINVKVQKLMADSLSKKLKLEISNGLRYNPGMNDDVNDILDFLEKNNVAKRGEVKSFSLNENELRVNDVKQPASLHEQLKNKYIFSKGDYINFLQNGENRTISMQRNRPDPV
ncbi:MAG: M48 family metalloprotease [Chitinophagaceae bacterium]|nr:M48 family metalloprotease [Chitinophagaceae bacterium]